jgi:GIY-YIG catalytic domain protein
MKESQIAVMEEFVDNVKVLINALGYKVLEPFAQVVSSSSTVDDELLFITSGSVNATGKVTTEGFVVFAGTMVNEKISAKSLSAGMQKLRQTLFNSDKVQNCITTEDILFSSSSAADFILGYSVSGPRTWKTKEGKILKEIEDS